MEPASLALLKGGKTAPTPTEAPAQPPVDETDRDAETVEVDVDEMDGPALDALVHDNGIETPKTWAKMSVTKKRAWLKEQFGDDGEGQAAEDAPSDAPEGDEAVKAAAALKPAQLAAAAANTPAPSVEEKVSAKMQAVAAALGDKIEEPKKAKTKAKAKGTAVAASDVKNGEIVEPDVLQDLVHEIENMKEKEAKELVGVLTEQTEVTFFKLGGVLSLIQANSWYEPYASFREFVEKEHGLHYRKATYWVDIYNRLSNAGVPWVKVSKLGWTKLKEIAKVLTPENVDEWVKIADEQNTITLIDTVKNHLAKDAPKALEDQTAKTVTTMTFKVHEDQKLTIKGAIDKAKEQSGTGVDTAALEFICMDYMGSQTTKQKLQAMGFEAAMKVVEEAFPNAEISVTLSD